MSTAEDLRVDSDTIRECGTAIRTAAGNLPEREVPNLDDCGSSRVAGAAHSWAMWATAQLMLMRSKASALGGNTVTAAASFTAADDALHDAL